jgi:putative membrane protein
MILGIYDKMIFSLNSLFKPNKDKKINKLENFLFLLEAGGGAIVGVLTLYKLISFLMLTFGIQMSFFFVGTVAGGIPLIFKAAEVVKARFSDFVWIALGIAAVVALMFLPEGLFKSGNFAIKVLGGAIAAAALVLPGISVSQMLLTMGLYTFVYDSASSLDIVPLIPFGIGLVLGVVATSGGMEIMMKKFKRQTYLAVMGFVIGSVGGLIKDALGRIISAKAFDGTGECYKNILGEVVKYEAENGGMEVVRTTQQISDYGFIMKGDLTVVVWVACALLAVAGFIAVYCLSRAEDKKSNDK